MKQKLLTAIASVAVVLSAGFMPEDAAAFEPSRPIELVVHSAPGGGSDVFAKELAKIIETEKVLGQPLRIVNKTARAGLEAMAYLVEKKGADHTIAIFTNTWIATPLTAKDARYTVRDLTPLVRLVLEPTIAVVRADQPHKTMREFVEAARKAILDHVGRKLAKWQVPDDVVFVDSLPLTATGKISKKDLRARFADHEIDA